MSAQELLSGMDDDQQKAVTLQTNGVVSAGAGSGKTRVLASRYVWLVTEKNLKPEEILTLTFTNKAVSEMYSRIYNYLLDESKRGGASGAKAADALDNFHKARISTLDSFSANIARTAAARYGISPDFSSDDTALRELAREAALRFILDNREAPAVRRLLVDHRIRNISEEVFANIVLNHTSISSPLQLDEMLSLQKKEIISIWNETACAVKYTTRAIIDELNTLAEIKKSIKFTKTLESILLENQPPSPPDITLLLNADVDIDVDTDEYANCATDNTVSEIRKQIKNYFDYYSAIIANRTPGNYGDVYEPLVENFKRLKGKNGDGLYYTLESVANYVLNFGLCSGVLELVGKFQDEFNTKKRESGLLSFNDIARLAVDALRDHPDIRQVYKDSIRMIMIDEFQDNNALQRDLIYLLAENSSRTEKGNPTPEELESGRMFFVGDEKQSIYRFRGADVAVFRSLGSDLFQQNGGGNLELAHNYRSRPRLIAAFNSIFDSVFLPPAADTPDYEAAYSRILPPDETSAPGDTDAQPLAHFCFLNKEAMPDDDTSGTKAQDLEASFIAHKIFEMVQRKEKIPKRGVSESEWSECTWSDFAVLQRSYTHQNKLEKYFREFGIPYSTDRPSGLFSDAPILDIRSYLRLLVYPEDRIAYAALIRSPFMRLSDLSLAVCMLNNSTEPFAEENEPLIPEADLALYRRARERYGILREAARTLSSAELVTKLWFEEGYRHETLWAESAQVYEGLFDLFFSLAVDSDARGRSLAEFIEYIEDVMNREEKPDAKDIPDEGAAGVRIMSIHKSKGLEFPVVFIYDCANPGRNKAFAGLANFHAPYGIILNVPRADELPVGGNYFRSVAAEKEKAKDIAELRRLLYVAVTRAEYRVFLTFTMPEQTKKEKEEWDLSAVEFNEGAIRNRLVQFNEKTESSDVYNTFLKLLAGFLIECPAALCGLEAIPVLSRADIRKIALGNPSASGETRCAAAGSQRETVLAAATFYDVAELLPEGKAAPASLEASKLRYSPPDSSSALADSTAEKNLAVSSPLDALLEKTRLSPAEAGTLIHAVLEDRLNRQPAAAPPKIRSRVDDENSLRELMSCAESMADAFLASALGKRWAVSTHHETEFSVVTSITMNTMEGKKIAVTGQIDLLFEEGGEIVAVDFKTDRIETPEDHYAQLAIYRQAATDIFGKPVSAWLFYLRSGRAVDVTESTAAISLGELQAEITI